MRKYSWYLFAFIFCIGCQKNDDNSFGAASTSASSPASFSAKIDGMVMTADSVKGYLFIDSVNWNITLRSFAISGYFQDMVLYPGFTDTLNTSLVQAINYNTAGWLTEVSLDYGLVSDTVNEYNSISAAFNITASDPVLKKVSGTFSGQVVGDVTGDTVNVTDGVFTNVTYEVQ